VGQGDSRESQGAATVGAGTVLVSEDADMAASTDNAGQAGLDPEHCFPRPKRSDAA
jgi:hypothetical protein